MPMKISILLLFKFLLAYSNYISCVCVSEAPKSCPLWTKNTTKLLSNVVHPLDDPTIWDISMDNPNALP